MEYFVPSSHGRNGGPASVPVNPSVVPGGRTASYPSPPPDWKARKSAPKPRAESEKPLPAPPVMPPAPEPILPPVPEPILPPIPEPIFPPVPEPILPPVPEPYPCRERDNPALYGAIPPEGSFTPYEEPMRFPEETYKLDTDAGMPMEDDGPALPAAPSFAKSTAPGDAAPYDGIYNGAPYDGMPYSGSPCDGKPHGNAPYGGMSYSGSPYDGMSHRGSPYDGMSYGGSPYDGMSYGGSPYDGMSQGSAPYDGMSHVGSPYDGMSPSGSPYDGMSHGGSSNDGMPYDGMSYGGVPYDGLSYGDAALTPGCHDTPGRLMSPFYISGFLRGQVGRLVRVESLTGDKLTERVGRLLQVGADYILLQSAKGHNVMCDLDSVRYATIAQDYAL